MPHLIFKDGTEVELTPEQWETFTKIYLITPPGVDKAIVKKDGRIYKISDLPSVEQLQKLKQKALDI